ncbi:MAG: hypothetical protein ACM3RP_07505 [Chitinophagales bacterium]
MTLPEGLSAPVALACHRRGLYLAGRPADLLLTLRRLAEAMAARQPSHQALPTLQQLLDRLAPPA